MAFKELLAQIGTEASRIRQTLTDSVVAERQATINHAQALRNAQEEERQHRENGRRIGEQLW